ncbi:Oligoribonuclease, mitochondrial [Geodia barretti]|uniref:Oligoribonuclease, mitochondrial n=1 Tax=Geodia barretti TaxID=519541 RepID=A0AA35S1R2_GEOBA|nr:Oligoribonuclease, mitochondrial [Geodia barretti]
MTSRLLQFWRKFIPRWRPVRTPESKFIMGGKAERLVWVDLEFSGLDVSKDQILEIACVITDKELNVLAEGPDIIIHQSDEVLGSMNDWCVTHHGESGLTEASRCSRVGLGEAEEQMLEFVKQNVPAGRCPLAGNTIHMDKRFLDKYMPRLMQHLHYRIVDVSSVKELCRRWYPAVFSKAPKKQLKHRAVEDIRESIAELKYYRGTIFKSS